MIKRLIIVIFFLFLLSNISALCEEGQININTASARELTKITYIGDARAEQIINLRPFDSVDDLINVVGIGEVYLSAIKQQGLACVDEEYEKEEEVTEKETKEEIPKTEMKNINNNKRIEKAELDEIVLNTKDIKSEDNKENLKGNLALGGIIMFCIVFGALFLLKGRKYKNEFQ